MSRPLVDKIWDQHVIVELGSGLDLLPIDRNLVHDLGSQRVFNILAERGLPVRNSELTFASADRWVSFCRGESIRPPNAAHG